MKKIVLETKKRSIQSLIWQNEESGMATIEDCVRKTKDLCALKRRKLDTMES